jgi:hypothetical protein
MEQNTATPQPDWAALGWITHRQPTEVDADHQGDVWLPRKAAVPFHGDTTFANYRTVVLGQPWYSHCAPEMQPTPAQPTPTEPDRIASRRVVQIAFDAVDAETSALIALCDDGSMWCSATGSPEWTELPAIPQP